MKKCVIFVVLILSTIVKAQTTYPLVPNGLGGSFISPTVIQFGGQQACLDRDGDGYGVGPACAGPDADDTDASVHAAADVITKYGSIQSFLQIRLGYIATRIWYISATGNDSTCAVNNAGLPCATYAHVKPLLAADDVAMFRAGTYSTQASWVVQASGTAGHPAITMSYPGEQAYFNDSSRIDTSGSTNYILDGIRGDDTQIGSDTVYMCPGNAILNGGVGEPNISSTWPNITLRHLDLSAPNDHCDWLIHITTGLQNVLIEDSVLHDNAWFSTNINGQAIIYLGSRQIPSTNVTIHRNIIYDAEWQCIHMNGRMTSTTIEQNICYNTEDSDAITVEQGFSNSRIANNSIFNTGNSGAGVAIISYPGNCYWEGTGYLDICPYDDNNNVIENNTIYQPGKEYHDGTSVADTRAGIYAINTAVACPQDAGSNYYANCKAATWAAQTSYTTRKWISPTVPNGHLFGSAPDVTSPMNQWTGTSCTSGSSEPTWTISSGTFGVIGTVDIVDGNCHWRDYGPLSVTTHIGDMGHNTYRNNIVIANMISSTASPFNFANPDVGPTYAGTSTFNNNIAWRNDTFSGTTNWISFGGCNTSNLWCSSSTRTAYTMATVTSTAVPPGPIPAAQFTNNQNVNPLFVAASTSFYNTPSSYNLNLQATSTAVKAGTFTGAPVSDVAGVFRNTLQGISIGAYDPGYPQGWTDLGPSTILTSKCPGADGSGWTEPQLSNGANYDFTNLCHMIFYESGGALDINRNRIVITGGGHSDYAGNELYALNLNNIPPDITRLNDPSLPAMYNDSVNCSHITSNSSPWWNSADTTMNNWAYGNTSFSGSPVTPSCTPTANGGVGDCRPNSRHIGGGLTGMPTLDKMYMFNGSNACGNDPHFGDTWWLDFATMCGKGQGAGTTCGWTQKDPETSVGFSYHFFNGTNNPQGVLYIYSLSEWDMNTNTIAVTGPLSMSMFSYQPLTNTYTQLATQGTLFAGLYGTIDPKRKLYIFMGNNAGPSTSGQVWLFCYSSTACSYNGLTNNLAANTFINVTTQVVANGGCGTNPSTFALTNGPISYYEPGMAYDPVVDKTVIWTGSGSTVYFFNPDTLNCTTQTFSNPPPDGAFLISSSTGTYGRFRYFPALDAFAVTSDPTKDAYLLRLNGTPASGGSFTLTVNNTGTGTGTVTSNDGNINCPTTCLFTYTSSPTVILTETPSSGVALFGGWSQDCAGTQNTCTLTMIASHNVTATFNSTTSVSVGGGTGIAAGTLVITTASPLPSVTHGFAYSQQLAAHGGAGVGGSTVSYNWVMSSPNTGVLPTGLTLSPTGLISGTAGLPVGTYNFVVIVQDGTGHQGAKGFSITVN